MFPGSFAVCLLLCLSISLYMTERIFQHFLFGIHILETIQYWKQQRPFITVIRVCNSHVVSIPII